MVLFVLRMDRVRSCGWSTVFLSSCLLFHILFVWREIEIERAYVARLAHCTFHIAHCTLKVLKQSLMLQAKELGIPLRSGVDVKVWCAILGGFWGILGDCMCILIAVCMVSAEASDAGDVLPGTTGESEFEETFEDVNTAVTETFSLLHCHCSPQRISWRSSCSRSR